MFTFLTSRLSLDHQAQFQVWARRLTVASAIVVFLLLGTAALSFETLFASGDRIDFQVGEVATRDVLAPRSLAYNSDILTEQEKQDAIDAVVPVYDPDPDVTRRQIRLAPAVTNYINEIRHDDYATEDHQIQDLNYLEDVSVSEMIWREVLALPETRWTLISQEVVTLVEETMRTDIRIDNLESVRGYLVNNVATRFSDKESQLVIAIAEDLIQPNTFYNEEATLERQRQAAEGVSIQERRFEKGQLIVRAGNIVTDLDMEALRQFGLLHRSDVQVQVLLASFLAMCLTSVVFIAYLDRFKSAVLHDSRNLVLIAVLFLIFLWGVHLFGSEGVNQPYLYPAAALALILTSLIGPEVAIINVSILALLVGSIEPEEHAVEFTALILIGSLTGTLSLHRVERLNSYFTAGVLVGVANFFIVMVFGLLQENIPAASVLLTRGFVGIANGLFAAGIALVALYFITAAMNLTTNLKLIELQDSKHPLLRRLLREAPGTYQHSLQVANLSEIAAESIGANAQLARVAAMYHDIGKILNPYYFTENTTGGINPHDDLNDPYQSAKVIIGHVVEGDRLARRHKLPSRIRDFILEHHGTTQVLHFYNQAVEKVGDESQVNIDEFTYPGPAPRSRETAIMMLADGCESATRSVGPSSKAEIEGIVNHIFELRLSEGQLDDSGLTLNDLKTIRNIFIQTLQAMYHPRIAYKIRKTTANGEAPQLASGIVKHLEGSNDARKPKSAVTQQMDKKPLVSIDELEDLMDENLVDTNISKDEGGGK